MFDAEKFQECLDWYQLYRKEGYIPEERTFFLLLHSNQKLGRFQEMVRLMDEMNSLKIRQNQTFYNMVMDAFAKAGNVEKVLSLFEKAIFPF